VLSERMMQSRVTRRNSERTGVEWLWEQQNRPCQETHICIYQPKIKQYNHITKRKMLRHGLYQQHIRTNTTKLLLVAVEVFVKDNNFINNIILVSHKSMMVVAFDSWKQVQMRIHHSCLFFLNPSFQKCGYHKTIQEQEIFPL
jgi:hypothetical protein